MYVIREKQSKEYVCKKWYHTNSNITKARTFTTKGHCTSSMNINSMIVDDYEILEVEIKLK